MSEVFSNTMANTGSLIPPSTGRSSTAFTVAVISDLHCFSMSDPARVAAAKAGLKQEPPSYFSADGAPADLQSDPITDLLSTLRTDNSMRANLLLCCGDLGDKASPTGIRHGWQKMHDIGQLLGVDRVIATAGNHDLDFLHYEPEGHLKALEPFFPLDDGALRASYWTDHYALLDGQGYRIICLNSSAHHTAGDHEKNHGRIGDRTLLSLRRELGSAPRRDVQILLCHHHPHQHADYQSGEHDVMKAGQHLLDLLSKHGNWLIIHGHKHQPKLTHAAGGSTAPWVFAAGSAAAYPWKATEGHARNQFYIVEFAPATFQEHGWGGRIRAWDWAPEDGWSTAGPQSGLPAECGFGFLGDMRLLSAALLQAIPPREKGFVRWVDLMAMFPQLSRVCPSDLRELDKCGVRLELDEHGVPCQVARAQ